MNTTETSTIQSSAVNTGLADLKFEAVVIPVADVDRATTYYTGLGWRLDADFAFDNGFRVVQFTPPGSHCSIHFGTHLTSAAPGSAQMLLIVSDIEAARDELAKLGVKVSEVYHYAGVNRIAPAEKRTGPKLHTSDNARGLPSGPQIETGEAK